jgi:hypothetical protein
MKMKLKHVHSFHDHRTALRNFISTWRFRFEVLNYFYQFPVNNNLMKVALQCNFCLNGKCEKKCRKYSFYMKHSNNNNNEKETKKLIKGMLPFVKSEV